jgi:hypothetical protein
MTNEERKAEGAEEAIEDLEAPATAQEDVAGGALCGAKSCGNPSMVCSAGTCRESGLRCTQLSRMITVFT